jgi:hypothetical protein
MPNKTLYVREVDLPLWEQAKSRFGERGVSSMFATFLRENLAVREGFLHILWADGKNDFEKGRFAVMFAPTDSEGAMKPHYCQGSRDLSRFLEKLGLASKGIDSILATIKQDRSAAEPLSLPQSVIQLFEPLAERVESALLKTVVASRLGPRALMGHQDHWGGWMRRINAMESECTQADLLSALKRLRTRGILRLTKPDQIHYEGPAYSGIDKDDDTFFFTGPFNVVLTDEGLKYWDQLANAR